MLKDLNALTPELVTAVVAEPFEYVETQCVLVIVVCQRPNTNRIPSLYVPFLKKNYSPIYTKLNPPAHLRKEVPIDFYEGTLSTASFLG